MFAYDRLIIGYHGCDVETAERLLDGEPFVPSENAYDWLGRGVYFWEHGPDRALQFAHVQVKRGRVRRPAVVGAVLQLGNCFDLLDTHSTEALAAFYPLWERAVRARGDNLPVNDARHLRRFLDCAIINAYLPVAERAAGRPYDTVRGCFTEGGPAFAGSGITRQAHIQIAVRSEACITGVFRPKLKVS